MTDTIYSFTVQPSTDTEVPCAVIDTAEGTLADAQAICAEYDCRIVLSDAAGFVRGWVRRGEYRLGGAA
jgi:hypothetical protein